MSPAVNVGTRSKSQAMLEMWLQLGYVELGEQANIITLRQD